MHSCYQPSSRLIVRASGRLLSIALPFSPPVPRIYSGTRLSNFASIENRPNFFFSVRHIARVSCLACGYADRESAEARPGEEGKRERRARARLRNLAEIQPIRRVRRRRRNSLASHSFFFFPIFLRFQVAVLSYILGGEVRSADLVELRCALRVLDRFSPSAVTKRNPLASRNSHLPSIDGIMWNQRLVIGFANWEFEFQAERV